MWLFECKCWFFLIVFFPLVFFILCRTQADPRSLCPRQLRTSHWPGRLWKQHCVRPVRNLRGGALLSGPWWWWIPFDCGRLFWQCRYALKTTKKSIILPFLRDSQTSLLINARCRLQLNDRIIFPLCSRCLRVCERLYSPTSPNQRAWHVD